MANERTESETNDITPEEMETTQQPPDGDIKAETTDESPTSAPEPAFGWTPYAELINGRFAMIGFVALLMIEVVTHKSFFQWLFG